MVVVVRGGCGGARAMGRREKAGNVSAWLFGEVRACSVAVENELSALVASRVGARALVVEAPMRAPARVAAAAISRSPRAPTPR